MTVDLSPCVPSPSVCPCRPISAGYARLLPPHRPGRADFQHPAPRPKWDYSAVPRVMSAHGLSRVAPPANVYNCLDGLSALDAGDPFIGERESCVEASRVTPWDGPGFDRFSENEATYLWHSGILH